MTTKPNQHQPSDTNQPDHTTPSPFRPSDQIGLFIRGLAMGAADVVPGVSGGTIAFITGIYERFITAVRSLTPRPLALTLRGNIPAAINATKDIHWTTLIPVLAGIAVAIVAFSKVITAMMEDKPGPTYALFFGLILASAWMPFSKMRSVNPKHIIAAIAAAIAAWLLVGLQPTGLRINVGPSEPNATTTLIYPGTLRDPADLQTITTAAAQHANANNINPADIRIYLLDRKNVLAHANPQTTADNTIPAPTVFQSRDELKHFLASPDRPPLVVLQETRSSLPYITFSGSVAISAMLLPGVSGSFLLLFLGQYHAVFGALHRLIGIASGGDTRADPALLSASFTTDFIFLAAFGIGILLGLYLFSRIIAWLLQHAHDVTMAALTGIMIGALRQPAAIVLTQAELATTKSTYWTTVAATAAVGATLVTALHFADKMRDKARDKKRANTSPTH